MDEESKNEEWEDNDDSDDDDSDDDSSDEQMDNGNEKAKCKVLNPKGNTVARSKKYMEKEKSK